ncbi:carbohydrate ABC transporter permease [Microbacterium hydrocarbonoxydans]|uniref:carbohydrate ABC transporter permease n=1 Tax=Microbacterium hydrocarbonoxydans TaxID=273678 RepID=UPI00203DF632|nr:sugar ABC transporter permease [Microbacterium hydrocarbonoxydans]MCM3778246.1 sugar ABC transporter permease [Microbacterium hydrocarbonoxydans]
MTATSAPAARAARHPGRRSTLEGQRRRMFWPFALPAVVLYLAFFIAPALFSVVAGFTRWAGAGSDMEFIGIGNYARLLRDPYFRVAFVNTLVIAVVCGVVVFTIAFAFSVALRELRHREALRSLLFLPYLISPIVMGIAFGLLLAPKGAVNTILRAVGLSALAIDWLGPDNQFRTIMAAVVWINIGFFVVLLMSGIDRIPPYFYEDADLAGVNAWQKFIHVTLPLSWDIVTIAVVLWLIGAIRVFDLVVAFTGVAGVPAASSSTIAVAQWAATTGGPFPAYEMGYGSAMGVFMVLLIGMLVVAVRRAMRRDALEF